MTQAFSQVSGAAWQPGRSQAIAALRLTPAELTSRLRVEFEEMEDDLDRFQLAVVRSPRDHRFALVRYIHNPSKGTEIWARSSATDMSAELREVLSILSLGLETLAWTHPRISKDSLVGSLGRTERLATARKSTRLARLRKALGSKRTVLLRPRLRRSTRAASKKK
jgi:hypothetical protein